MLFVTNKHAKKYIKDSQKKTEKSNCMMNPNKKRQYLFSTCLYTAGIYSAGRKA